MSKKRKDKKGRVLWKGERQEKDGRYTYRYTEDGVRRCIYSWRLVSTDPTPVEKKREKCLRDMEKDIRRAKEDGKKPDNPDMRYLNDFWDLYVSMKYEVKESTLVSYIYTYNRYVRDEFGRRPVAEIKYSDVKRFYLSLIKDDAKVGRLENVHSVVHPSFTLAVRDGYIRNNPSDGVLAEIRKKYAMNAANGRFVEENEEFFQNNYNCIMVNGSTDIETLFEEYHVALEIVDDVHELDKTSPLKGIATGYQ